MEKDKNQEIEVKETGENGTVAQPGKKKRRWPKVVGIILLVLVLIFAGILFFLDSILETGIRTGGSIIVKTKVEVDSVRLKLFQGTLDIKNLRVANPEGSTNPYALELPGFRIALDTGSLATNKVIIEDIEISGLKVDYEPRLKGGSNLQVLLGNMQDPDKQPPPEVTKSEAAEAKDGGKAEKNVVIRRLHVDGGQISVTVMGQAIPLALPALTITGIGENEDVTMAQAITIFLTKLVTNVIDVARSAGESLGAAAKSAGENLGAATDGIIDNFKDIFGKKDEKK